MDSTEQFTTLEWCAGYGGIQLGLKRAIPNLRTVAYSEIEAFPCANLVAKMEAGILDAAPIWTDIKTFPCQQFRGKVDCLIAGYPCQPFSAAGKRQGADDPRHLWPHIREAVGIIRPRYCFFENVEGHISLGLSTVISDLEEDGYRATWGIFSAEECGAPHRRKRVFILAKLPDTGYLPRCSEQKQQQEERAKKPGGSCELANSRCAERREKPERWNDSDGSNGQWQKNSSRSCELSVDELANSGSIRSETGFPEQEKWEERFTGITFDNCRVQPWPSRPGEPQHEWEPPRVVEYTADAGQPQWRDGAVGEYSGAEPEPKRPDGVHSEAAEREAQPSMGGNADGTAYRMDYAELYESCDNRTDELRLLGNGVVPATAERAWRVLYQHLKEV